MNFDHQTRKNVLLVEDNLPFSRSALEPLEDLGHSVIVCPNAKVSVSKFLGKCFDVIVLDLSISNSALEAMRVIQLFRETSTVLPPVLITSGHDRLLIEWAAAKVHTPFWIQKPLRKEELNEVLERATQGHFQAIDPRLAA